MRCQLYRWLGLWYVLLLDTRHRSQYHTVDQIPLNASSAFSGHILGSFGTLVSIPSRPNFVRLRVLQITISLVLPLSLVHLVDNVIFQIVSFIILLIITIIWIVIFAVRGLHIGHIPVVGHNQSTVVGFVLSNFSFVSSHSSHSFILHPMPLTPTGDHHPSMGKQHTSLCQYPSCCLDVHLHLVSHLHPRWMDGRLGLRSSQQRDTFASVCD